LDSGPACGTDAIRRPTVVVDRQRALANIERVVLKASAGGVRLRPHFKTHRSVQVGRWFRDFGIDAITVSSVSMARHFAADGWSDITVAFPLNVRELDEVEELAGSVRLGVVVDSAEALHALASGCGAGAGVWVKVDAGGGRAGVPWEEPGRAAALALAVSRSGRLRFEGILSHDGHTYAERSPEGVRRASAESHARMVLVRDAVLSSGLERCLVSTGDTPSASVCDAFDGADEIRPGNFVFNDLTQVAVGSCARRDIAVAVACPVVGVQRQRGRIVLYGGSVHLSKERLDGVSGPSYGEALERWPGNGEGARVVSVSQEHGLVEADVEVLERTSVGDLLYVLPVHSCQTCSLHRGYVTLDGETLEAM
jgi:D-serine deaminase-like pyridoxal phosphate-dependent protein